MHLGVDFEIGLNDDFALETALFVETGPFAVKGKMVEVIADDKLALIDSFEEFKRFKLLEDNKILIINLVGARGIKKTEGKNIIETGLVLTVLEVALDKNANLLIDGRPYIIKILPAQPVNRMLPVYSRQLAFIQNGVALVQQPQQIELLHFVLVTHWQIGSCVLEWSHNVFFEVYAEPLEQLVAVV